MHPYSSDAEGINIYSKTPSMFNEFGGVVPLVTGNSTFTAIVFDDESPKLGHPHNPKLLNNP